MDTALEKRPEFFGNIGTVLNLPAFNNDLVRVYARLFNRQGSQAFCKNVKSTAAVQFQNNMFIRLRNFMFPPIGAQP